MNTLKDLLATTYRLMVVGAYHAFWVKRHSEQYVKHRRLLLNQIRCSTCHQPMDSAPCSRNPETGKGGHTYYGGVAARDEHGVTQLTFNYPNLSARQSAFLRNGYYG